MNRFSEVWALLGAKEGEVYHLSQAEPFDRFGRPLTRFKDLKNPYTFTDEGLKDKNGRIDNSCLADVITGLLVVKEIPREEFKKEVKDYSINMRVQVNKTPSEAVAKRGIALYPDDYSLLTRPAEFAFWWNSFAGTLVAESIYPPESLKGFLLAIIHEIEKRPY